MKEATGELSITVITVVAVAAVATLFYTLVWPSIQHTIKENACSAFGEDYHAYKVDGKQRCCKGTSSGSTSYDSSTCIIDD